MTIVMPEIAKVSIFMDNDLTHITDHHFEIKLIARLSDICCTATFVTTEV